MVSAAMLATNCQRSPGGSSGGEARQMLERLVSDYGVGRLVTAVRRDQTRWELGS